MQSDEQEIRQLVATWMAATKAGDIETVLSLMADDVVFLMPGRPPMIGKSAFAAAAKAQSDGEAPQFDGKSEIQEIQVLGEWAFMWTKLSVVITPPGGARSMRSGHTLSILKKQNGKWVLARDANMLSPCGMMRRQTPNSSAMTPAVWFTEIWRWVLALAAAVVAFFTVLYFSLFVLFFGPFPKDLAEPTAGFLMGSLIVLAGSMLAPRRQLITAIFLFVLGTGITSWLLSVHAVGGLTGGLLAVAFVAWWFPPGRTRRSTMRVGVVVGAACLAFLGLVYARHVDWPSRPDQLPRQLSYALGTNPSDVAAFYRYDLGGFIGHEWLWRIDAKPDVVARVVSGLRLRSTDTVPPRFWRMPPYYWPSSMPAGAEAFQSSAFSADSRGLDGEHYFLVHDKTQDRAFVWLKNNF